MLPIKKLLGSDTSKWYLSRFLWMGAGQIIYGLLKDTPEWIFTGIGTILLRFDTKKGLRK